MKKKLYSTNEVVIRLVDGRLKYGVILKEQVKTDYFDFVSNSCYTEYSETENPDLVEHLPSGMVSSISNYQC